MHTKLVRSLVLCGLVALPLFASADVTGLSVQREAMKAFAQEVCSKPYVRCTTFSELVQYLDTAGPPQENTNLAN